MEELVAEIIISLTKTIKAFQMYGISHPITKNFFIPFYQKIEEFLKNYKELSFRIERFTMLHSNLVVYEDKERDTSIAFKLFRDGIRNITFYEGLETDELFLFLETISQPLKEQDIALSLWECDFSHISFYVVEEEESLTYQIPETRIENIDYDTKITEMIQLEKLDMTKSIMPDLNPDELIILKSEISSDQKKEMQLLAINTLINFLNIEKSEEIINSLIELSEQCINNNDFYNARRIIHKLNAYPEFKIIERFENEVTILSFKNLPDTLNEKSFNEFIAFIGFFSKKTVPYLMTMISTVKRKERLESLRYRIAYICQDDPTPILPFLEDKNTTRLINAIAILGIMRLKETITYLRPLFYHAEPPVRMEVVTALAETNEPMVIFEFLNDTDPNVRIKVLQTLAQNRYPKIYPELLRRIKSREFPCLNFIEQKEFFNCLVVNGDHTITKNLERFLFKWVLFGKANYRAIRKLAALALAQVGSEETLKILQKGIKKKNKEIKSACETALKQK